MREVNFELSPNDLMYVFAEISFGEDVSDPGYKLEWNEARDGLLVRCLPKNGDWTAPLSWNPEKKSWMINHPRRSVPVRVLVDLGSLRGRISEHYESALRLHNLIDLLSKE